MMKKDGEVAVYDIDIYIYISFSLSFSLFLSFSRADGSMEEGRKEGMESWWSSLLICTRLECGPLY